MQRGGAYQQGPCVSRLCSCIAVAGARSWTAFIECKYSSLTCPVTALARCGCKTRCAHEKFRSRRYKAIGLVADLGADEGTQHGVSSPERTRASSTCICRLCALPELLVTRFQSDVGVWSGSLAAIARPAKACSQFVVRSQYSPLGTPAISPVPQRVKKVVLGQPFS